MSTQIRPAVAADIPSVLALWRQAAAPTSTDTGEAVGALLQRDSGALIVAEESGAVVGSVIAGWDGWRGSIYRLAVAPACRRQGLGGRLLKAAERRLAEAGAHRLHAIVVGSEGRAVSFWESTDWEHQDGQLRFTKG